MFLSVCLITLFSLVAAAALNNDERHMPSPSPSPLCYDALRNFSIPSWSSDFANLTRILQPVTNSSAQNPSFIALPTSEAELQRALQCAHRYDLPVAIKGGGHSFAAYSRVASPGFVVSLAAMSAVILDERTHRATAYGAARWRDVYSEFAKSTNRYQVVGGLCPSVGVVAYSLGGGVGPLARSYGLALDNVVSFRLTLANGSATLLVERNGAYSDLFWAALGAGGGQFGVVAAITFQAHIGVAAYTYGTICYQAYRMMNGTDVNGTAASIAAMQRIAAFSEGMPEWLNIDSEMNGDDGSGDGAEVCLWIVSAADINTTVNAMRPFWNGFIDGDLIIEPSSSSYHQSHPGLTISLNQLDCFWEAIQAFSIAKGYSAYSDQPFLARAYLLPEITPSVISAVAKAQQYLPSDECGQEFIQFGGQTMTRKWNETAFPWRNTKYMLYVGCAYNGTHAQSFVDTQAIITLWANTIHPHSNGSYVNFIDPYLPDWPALYYGDNLARLIKIKQSFNPLGVGPLRFPMEIGRKATSSHAVGSNIIDVTMSIN